MHSHIDALFEIVQDMITTGEDPSSGFYERLLAVEELQRAVTIETLLYIARQQPIGKELTKAEGYIKASYDLYRISRYLREIVKLNDIAGPLSNLRLNTGALAKSRAMVNLAVKSLLTNDPDPRISKTVVEADKDIDTYYLTSLKELTNPYVTRDKAIEALFARHVERIADHATYLAKVTDPDNTS